MCWWGAGGDVGRSGAKFTASDGLGAVKRGKGSECRSSGDARLEEGGVCPVEAGTDSVLGADTSPR